jgi:hypothetical protein
MKTLVKGRQRKLAVIGCVLPAFCLGLVAHDALAQQATISLVTLQTPSPTDEVTTLPTSETMYQVNDIFYVEIWAQTPDPSGFTSVIVNLEFDSTLLVALSIQPTALFNLFTSGTIDNPNGMVVEVGGSHLGIGCGDQVGFAPNWGRAAIVQMQVIAAGQSTIASAHTGSLLLGTTICGQASTRPTMPSAITAFTATGPRCASPAARALISIWITTSTSWTSRCTRRTSSAPDRPSATPMVTGPWT